MDGSTIAWVLTSTALVLFMTPGLALFYGGLDESKNVSNMMSMNLYCMGIVPILWVVCVYALSFGNFGGEGNAFIGDLEWAGLNNVTNPESLRDIAFLATFAIITPALISGAVAGRMKFSAWAWFVPLWLIFVYAPVTHWVFAADGWILNLPSYDFAGGTSIHINAGVAALVLSKMLGPRRGWPSAQKPPHNLPLVALGTGILWLGWFGFNAGSALAADEVAIEAFTNTLLAASAGMLGWVAVEHLSGVRTNIVGICSGVVAALVAITPGCAVVRPWAAILIGFIASMLCFLALGMKKKFNYDDSLDVVGIHGVGGIIGALMIGFFADDSVASLAIGDLEGLFFSASGELLLNQFIAVISTIAYSALGTFVIAWVLKKTVGLRASDEAQIAGLDHSEHSSSSYLL